VRTGGCAPFSFSKNLVECSAGDTIAAVAGWLGNLVISACMNYQCSAIGIKESRRACCDRDSVGGELHVRCPISANSEVWRVAGMRSRWIIQAVLHVRRVIVSARRAECGSRRRITLTHCVEMDRVRACRESGKAEIHVNLTIVVLPHFPTAANFSGCSGERDRGSSLPARQSLELRTGSKRNNGDERRDSGNWYVHQSSD
jgi:hypothetical protein